MPTKYELTICSFLQLYLFNQWRTCLSLPSSSNLIQALWQEVSSHLYSKAAVWGPAGQGTVRRQLVKRFFPNLQYPMDCMEPGLAYISVNKTKKKRMMDKARAKSTSSCFSV